MDDDDKNHRGVRGTTLERIENVGFNFISSEKTYDIYRNEKAEIHYNPKSDKVVRTRLR